MEIDMDFDLMNKVSKDLSDISYRLNESSDRISLIGQNIQLAWKSGSTSLYMEEIHGLNSRMMRLSEKLNHSSSKITAYTNEMRKIEEVNRNQFYDSIWFTGNN